MPAVLTQIGNVTFSEPVDGFALIISVRNPRGSEVLSRKTLDDANRRARAISAFRLEHARQTDYVMYIKICRARQITPDPTSPAPSHYTGDFRDWPIQ